MKFFSELNDKDIAQKTSSLPVKHPSMNYGEENHIKLSILFTELPVEFIRGLRDVTVVENETATLTCEPSRTNADIKWYKDGKELDVDGKKFNSVLDGKKLKLVITDAQLDDAGQYACEIDGRKTSAALIVEGIAQE